METLATEVIHEVKRQSKRIFVAFIIVLILLVATNVVWLVAWSSTKKHTMHVSNCDIQNSSINTGKINGKDK